MWVVLTCLIFAAIISAWAIVDAIHSATETIIGELKSSHRHTDNDSYGLHGIELDLKGIKELLSISCPLCGDEPLFLSPVAEQRVWLEEHMAEHKSGKLERRALDDLVAERLAAEKRNTKSLKLAINISLPKKTITAKKRSENV